MNKYIERKNIERTLKFIVLSVSKIAGLSEACSMIKNQLYLINEKET